MRERLKVFETEHPFLAALIEGITIVSIVHTVILLLTL